LRELRDEAETTESPGDWSRLVECVERLANQTPGGTLTDVSVYRRWIATTARFSFHTRDLIEEAT